MKRLLLISSLLLTSMPYCFAQRIQWQTSDRWTLYQIQNKRDYNLPIDSLNIFEKIILNTDSVVFFIKSAEEWPKDKYSLWMGRYLCTCRINNAVHKIFISVYAGFFYDELSSRYYQVPAELIDEWLKFWNTNYLRLHY